MNVGRIIFALTATAAVVRSVILMRRREYRLFPLLFLGFLIGAIKVVRGFRRFLGSDSTLIPTYRHGGQAWYQDIGAGLFFAIIATIACVAYIENKKKPNPEGCVSLAETRPLLNKPGSDGR